MYSQERPYVCNTCGKGFARKSDLTRHTRIHTNDRPFKCSFPNCNRAFIQNSALTVHKRVHTGEKPHRCEVSGCSSAFSDSSSLARHRRVHTGNRPYQCPYAGCGKTFCRKNTLTKHRKIHEELEGGAPLEDTGSTSGSDDQYIPEPPPEYVFGTYKDSHYHPLPEATPTQANYTPSLFPRFDQNYCPPPMHEYTEDSRSPSPHYNNRVYYPYPAYPADWNVANYPVEDNYRRGSTASITSNNSIPYPYYTAPMAHQTSLESLGGSMPNMNRRASLFSTTTSSAPTSRHGSIAGMEHMSMIPMEEPMHYNSQLNSYIHAETLDETQAF